MNKPDEGTLGRLNERVAELCGWRHVGYRRVLNGRAVRTGVFGTPPCHPAPYVTNERVPDYTGSLDAIHEAEAQLINRRDLRALYQQELDEVAMDSENRAGEWFLVHAEAWQRAIAIDRSLNTTPIL